MSPAQLHADTRPAGPLPSFVTRRVQDWHSERVAALQSDAPVYAWTPSHADALQLAGNDYLCLAGERELSLAQARTLSDGGGSMVMSSVFLQPGCAQSRLERRFADFWQAEETVLCQSGYAANVGLIQALSAPGVPVYLDMLAHASLWDGVQSAQAEAIGFLHNDAGHLGRMIERRGPGVIVVDSVYSTNGSVAPLQALVDIAERSGSILVVDESHSLGTHGPQGAGLVVAEGLQGRVHFRTASLAKAFAGRAGIITCPGDFKTYFVSTSRPAIFSSCLLRHELSWFQAALEFIRAADDRRAALMDRSRQLRSGLDALGYNVGDGTEQIIALEAGTEPATLVLRQALDRRGVYGSVFCAPATARNRALVRLTVNSGLSEADIARVLHACADMREEVDLAQWSSTRRSRRLALV